MTILYNYVNNTYSNADEVYQIAVIGENKNFSYSAWYTTLQDSDYTSTGVSTTDANYAATATQISIFKGDDLFKIGLNYAILEPDDTTSRTLSGEQKQIVLYMNNQDKTVKYSIAYIETGSDGGNVAIDQTTDSEANYSLDEIGANDIVNGKAYYLMVSKDFSATDGLTIQYFNGDGTTSAEETKFTYTSYLDKNLYYYVAYDMWSKTSQTDSEKFEVGFNISF